MQKQSFELITNVERAEPVYKLIFKSRYPKIFFLLTVYLRAFFLLLKDPKIQVVHANDGLMALFISPLLAIKRIKLCATIHGLDVVFNHRAYQWWVRKYLSRFDLLIAVSEATRQECIARGVPEDRAIFIPNAVELPDHVGREENYFHWVEKEYGCQAKGKAIISSVGRPVPRKGFAWFAREVLPAVPDAKYLIVGTKIENGWVISFLRKVLSKKLFQKACIMLGVPLDNIELGDLAAKNDQIVLLGKIPYDKLLQTYLHTDIFVMPNRHVEGDFEGFGLVALEAASLGAICVASEVDGIPSAVKDGENGFLLPAGDKKAWTSKIKQLTTTSLLSEARAKFEAYFNQQQMSWEEMSAQYLAAFEQLLANEFKGKA